MMSVMWEDKDRKDIREISFTSRRISFFSLDRCLFIRDVRDLDGFLVKLDEDTEMWLVVQGKIVGMFRLRNEAVKKNPS